MAKELNKSEIHGIANDIIYLMNSPTGEEGKKTGLSQLIKELQRELDKTKGGRSE